ncbi:coenzyme F420-0:L-glutamate ligase/coenzyme F420-1:gamma-L-glutamate ligase [Ancylobacter sp. 3268]|uniref:coenzyme F420-0:L-glutamate ligase n=1 Tax=Ancylobacter sp. 3268 TaxID=2817752 RepID=UPI0028667E2F|nr:coenzyme F420-0:L-glutamate ligase [Ancylobacter sp. 3268]MDR6951821.1 coenzyme F420-0:L-glutamate ligase/coenzyme F420-1:gamma-L-glutamate ligase [Ancylobacter sp. 3268]
MVQSASRPAARLEIFALPDFPLVEAGDDLAGLILDGVARLGLGLAPQDVVVLAQKVVSKAEGRLVRLAEVTPSARATALAQEVRKDARLVELILSESVRVVRTRPDVLIVEHRLGLVMANAGIDQSNIRHDGGEAALLLPLDPDASADRLRAAIERRTGVAPGVVINDSFGRPWRRGTTGIAIGAAGLPSMIDRRGETDLFGRTLRATMIAHADEIAAAASLVMGQSTEATPVVLVRGLAWSAADNPAATLIRTPEEDLFR